MILSLPSSLDGVRAVLVLLLAVSQCLMAFWPDLRGWPETTATRSAALDTPVVPVGGTFAIWGLIFASSMLFAIWQALPANLHHPLAHQVGWIAAVVFAANTLWEYVVPRFGMGWWSVVLALTELLGLGLILILLAEGGRGLGPVEWWLVAAPFHLFAGWVTAAVVVNLSSVLRARGASVGPARSVLLLLVAGAVALGIVWTTSATVYGLAVLWALGGVALAARGKTGRSAVLATSLALMGALGVALI